MTTAEAHAVIAAMDPKERYAFELACTYGCKKMAQTIWNRARARAAQA